MEKNWKEIDEYRIECDSDILLSARTMIDSRMIYHPYGCGTNDAANIYYFDFHLGCSIVPAIFYQQQQYQFNASTFPYAVLSNNTHHGILLKIVCVNPK